MIKNYAYSFVDRLSWITPFETGICRGSQLGVFEKNRRWTCLFRFIQLDVVRQPQYKKTQSVMQSEIFYRLQILYRELARHSIIAIFDPIFDVFDGIYNIIIYTRLRPCRNFPCANWRGLSTMHEPRETSFVLATGIQELMYENE